tara:strand:+ start:463 stop:1191 length:729 start_codon:yes stop_codon:yes gene_type:complete
LEKDFIKCNKNIFIYNNMSNKELELIHDISNDYELCLDEVGRGCMFGNVYIACVVLPKDNSFDKKEIKDSKKIKNREKLNRIAEYIKEVALFWHVESIDVDVIDSVNILQSVMIGMHNCIDNILSNIDLKKKKVELLIDGNYFNEYKCKEGRKINHITVEKGDGKYLGIAAASILAKSSRDNYILDLCEKYPILKDNYGLHNNMGYGTKIHLDGIEKHGITQLHRKTFGKCKNFRDKIKDIV